LVQVLLIELAKIVAGGTFVMRKQPTDWECLSSATLLSEYQLIRTRAESLTQSGWGRTVLRSTLSSLAWSGAS